jgi:hypothetical protein
MLPDPDPHSQYGSGSRTAKRMRSWIDNTVFHHWCRPLQRAQAEGHHIFEDSSLQPPLPYFRYPLEHFIISGSEDGQHPGDRRGGQGAHQRHLHPQEPRRERGDDPLRKAALRMRQPLLFIGSSRRHCAGANRFCLLAQVGGDTAQAPTASIYWLKSATLGRRQPLLFIG